MNDEKNRDWVIETHDLVKVYQLGEIEIQVLHGVTLRIAAGEFVALVGASGSGKSTLMHLLGCLEKPTAGSYSLEGQEVSALSERERVYVRNRRIGFVFQSFHLLPRQTALENVMLPLLYCRQATDREERARASLSRVGLDHRRDHRPAQLSGGERQRVAIARALVANPSIILADEPTGNLDSVTSRGIIDLLKELHEEDRTIVMVTHDGQVAASAQRILHMQDGVILDTGVGQATH